MKNARFINVVVSKLFNASNTKGQFNEMLKIARVKPIFMAGLRDTITNYRPISALMVLSKI